MSPTSDDPRVGMVVQDRYRILEPLASGGMGVVYRAERVGLGRVVAMKFLHAGFSSSPQLIERFDREAKLMSRLDHPHCVSVIDFGVADSPFIVMEFVSGTTLRAALRDHGRMPVPRALRIGRQILAGLAHAHDRGIVHRDIKPANIVLAQHTGTGDHVRVLDFGLAKLRDSDASTSGIIAGTPNYMSPEQASGGPIDGRTDIYSTALVLFELLTGERVFYADEPLAVLQMHRAVPPPQLADRCDATFPPRLEAALQRALAKAPDARFATPSEFADELAKIADAPARAISSEPTAVALAETVALAAAAPVPARRPRRGNRLLVAALIAGAIAVVAWQTGWLDRATERAVSAADEIRALAADDEPRDAAPAPASLAAAERLAESGDVDAALRMVHDLRRADPDDARLAYALGDLYYRKQWPAEGLAAYAEALEARPAYRKQRALLVRVIDALGEPKTRERARAMLRRNFGRAATAELRRAAKQHASAAVRKQAASLLAEPAFP